jgi:hypothetical protein
MICLKETIEKRNRNSVRLTKNWVYYVYSYKWEHCRSVRNVLFVAKISKYEHKKLTIYVGGYLGFEPPTILLVVVRGFMLDT